MPRRAPIPAVPLPEGVPVFTGSLGRYGAVPGHLPAQLLFDDFDLLWVIRGRADLSLRDGARFSAGTGEFALLPPGIPATIDEGAPGLRFWFCHFGFRPVPRLLPAALRRDGAGPGAAAIVPLAFSGRDAPAVLRAFRALARVRAGSGEGCWRIERAVLDLAAALARFGEGRPRGGEVLAGAPPLDRRVAEVRRRVEEDPGFSWTVPHLARSVGLSAGGLSALWRRSTAGSLKGFLVEARLRDALKRLRGRPGERPPSIREVAEACGYSSQHFFSRQFRTRFGTTPLKWRNRAVEL